MGRFPFNSAEESDPLFNLIKQGKEKEYRKKIDIQCKNLGFKLSANFKDLVLKMLSYDPTKRPTIKQIKKHKWITQKHKKKDGTK